ncbi:MAG: energy transducer TonB [Clostridia bacterium]|nr:energy transducer TonB [Clostridia bacterium]
MKTNKATGEKTAGNGAGSSCTFLLKRFFLIIFVLMISAMAHAQSDTTDLPEIELIFVAEKMPTFPGGDEARMRYVISNAVYTRAAQDANAGGRVYVSFWVEADGSITQARILKGVHPDLDSISLDLVNQMPDWIPAEQRGKPVRCQFTMPIRFGPEMSKYWRKKGEKRFLKICGEQYGKSRAECDCWFNFIIWNYNDKTLKSLDLDEIFKNQKCE